VRRKSSNMRMRRLRRKCDVDKKGMIARITLGKSFKQSFHLNNHL